jgi:electron transfer flavoprotein alpha subunit
MSNVLIYVEQAGGELKKASLSAITFGQELAAKRGGELHLALVGSGLDVQLKLPRALAQLKFTL